MVFVAFSRIRSSNVKSVDQRSITRCCTRLSILPQTEIEEDQAIEAEVEEVEEEDPDAEGNISVSRASQGSAVVKKL